MLETNSIPSIDQLTPTLVQNGDSSLQISTDLSNVGFIKYFIGLISHKYGLRIGRREFVAMMRLVPLIMIELILLSMGGSIFLKNSSLYFSIIVIVFFLSFLLSVFITFRLIKGRLCDLNTEANLSGLFGSLIDLTLRDGTVGSNKFGPDPTSFLDQFTANDYGMFNLYLLVIMIATVVVSFFVFFWVFITGII